MAKGEFDLKGAEPAWCPGCGNFAILNALKGTLEELNLSPGKVVMASGIGQAAKTPHYLKANVFNGLHGRALPAATAIKASNPGLTVIAESGDGDMYGEGGNHFIHAARRNPDITCIVHNNMVYGLTKGQASPTSQGGFRTPVQVDGVSEEQFNPVATAISLNASFVGRAFCGDFEKTKEIFKEAIRHRGFSLVDVFQPCVTYNDVNTYSWFRENTYYLDKAHDRSDRTAAFGKATEKGKLALGVFYERAGRTFEEELAAYGKDKNPFHGRKLSTAGLRRLVDSFRGDD